MARVMGLDVGGARVGVAISDPSLRLATPVETVAARPESVCMARIATLCAEYGVDRIVVGIPLELSGREGHAVRRTRRFVDALMRAVTAQIVEHDERLTSAQAERVLIEGGMRRADRKDVIDQAAAVLILQSWLDMSGRI